MHSKSILSFVYKNYFPHNMFEFFARYLELPPIIKFNNLVDNKGSFMEKKKSKTPYQ